MLWLGTLNLGNSLLRGWICNRQVAFVAIRPGSYHGHQQVSGAEIPEFERCVSSPTTFPLGGPILEEKEFGFSVSLLEKVAAELAPCCLYL